MIAMMSHMKLRLRSVFLLDIPLRAVIRVVLCSFDIFMNLGLLGRIPLTEVVATILPYVTNGFASAV